MSHLGSHNIDVAPGAHQQPMTASDQPQSMNHKALRLAVHGWRLGNPLVYKPGVADLMAIARELAGAGVASGALVLGAPRREATSVEHAVRAILILRSPASSALLGAAAAQTVAEVAQATLGRPCAVRGRWRIVVSDNSQAAVRLCGVSVEQDEDAALLDVRLAFDQLRRAAPDDASQAPAALFGRADWREVFLARVLHRLDDRLRTIELSPQE